MPFSLKYTASFKTSIEKLSKSKRFKKNQSEKKILQDKLKEIFKEITVDPFFVASLISSEPEPLPSKLKLPSTFEFRKIRFKIGTGASGQVRIIYLINRDKCTVSLLSIFTHEEYEKRPPDGYLKAVIQNAFEEE